MKKIAIWVLYSAAVWMLIYKLCDTFGLEVVADVFTILGLLLLVVVLFFMLVIFVR